MRTNSSAIRVCRPSVSLAWLSLLLFVGFAASRDDRAFSPKHDAHRIQALVDELKAKLGISQDISVSLVRANPLLVSVGEHKQRSGAFELSFEDGFLDSIDDDELRAIVAHELGHVWIFTHHPYLQTERGANDIAMRVVTRDVLERVYAKVWARGGTKGDLVRFLGAQ
jgi:hypothetical protein